MFNFVKGLFNGNNAKFLADVFGVIFGVFGATVKNTILNILGIIWNLVTKYIWFICKWVLAALDIMQIGFTRLLGLYTANGAEMTADDYINGLKEITVSGGSTYYDYIMKIFKAMVIVAIVLMIVFTIVSMVMQDYNLAVNGYGGKSGNAKGGFIRTIVSNIITIILIPLIFYTVIVGVNSILTSFYRALGNYSDTTLAGNVLAASTYDANRYRAYANAGQRIPITISVYSTENAFGKEIPNSELQKEIQDSEVQEKLKAIGGAFANNSFLPFEKSTVYVNGNWESYANYSLTYNNTVYDDMGQYFENFICTREQYYVLADFIDYCQLYNINYYIKEISEPDICWKYVSSLYANSEVDEDGNAYGDITLTVNYRNAESVNSPAAVASAVSSSGSGDTYSLKLTTKLDLTSPISDALSTASKLLGIQESTSNFNVMERDDSGDFTNLVEWSTEKVLIKLSAGFKLDDPKTWTFSDQIIVYEYYRFQNDFNSTNNTLEDYTLGQLQSLDTCAKLDVLELAYRNYNSNTQSYSDEKTLYCTKINSSYYRVKESERYFDDYGNPYYELDALDTNVDYFTDVLVGIKKHTSVKTRLSRNFDINKPSGWTFTDQVLVYEYFSNGSINSSLDGQISNGQETIIDFTLLNYSSSSTYAFDVYTITVNGIEQKYLKINNTYYECDASGNLNDKAASGTSSVDFLIDSSTAGNWWYGYKLTTADEEKYGIKDLDKLLSYVTGISGNTTDELDDSDAFYQKYSSVNKKLSEDFSFYNSETWTFKDYAIMYLYYTKLSDDSSITLDSLSVFGIKGDIVKDKRDNKYYYKVEINNGRSTETEYLDLEAFNNISELKITSSISLDIFNNLNFNTTYMNLIKSFSSDISSEFLLDDAVSSKTFYYSDDFDDYEPTTWTVGDYLLMILMDNGYIDKLDTSYLKNQGYGALVYEVNGDKYYRFGKSIRTENTDTKNDNVYFLSEEAVNNLGYTSTKLFKTNLLSFLLNNYYKLNFSNMYYTADEFEEKTGTNFDQYIYNIYNYTSDYDIENDASSINSLQYFLAEEFLKIYENEILDDSNLLKYTYSNPNLVANDLSTWNALDTAIYLVTGKLPTTKEPYESYLYQVDSKLYMIVSDIFVNVTNLLYKSGSVHSNRIFSNHSVNFSSKSQYEEYYKNNFSTAFLTLGETTTVVSATEKRIVKTEIKAVDGKTYYVKTTTKVTTDTSGTHSVTTEAEDKTEIDISNFYYYSSSLIGSDNASVSENTTLTDFELVLSTLGVEKTSNGYYSFEKYTIDGESYAVIKAGTDYYYLNISNLKSAYVYYEENSLIANNASSVFTKDGTYTAFDNDSTNDYRTIFGTQINKYDSILYSIAATTLKTEYQIYKFTKASTYYCIFISGKIVRYNSSDATSVQRISTSEATLKEIFPSDSSVTDETEKLKNAQTEALNYAQALYNNYYIKHISTGVPSIESSLNIDEINNYVPFDVNNMSTWTPLSIIMRFISDDGKGFDLTDSSNTKSIITSRNGSYYLQITVDGDVCYIDLTGIVDTKITKSPDGTKISVSLEDMGKTEMFMRLGLVYKYTSSGSVRYSIRTYNSLAYTYLKDAYLTNIVDITDDISYSNFSYLSVLDGTGAKDPSKISDLTSYIKEYFSWFGLMGIYFDQSTATIYYYNGQNYFVFNSGMKTYLIPVSRFGDVSITSRIIDSVRVTKATLTSKKLKNFFNDSTIAYDGNKVLGKVIDNYGYSNSSGNIINLEGKSGITSNIYIVRKDNNFFAICNLPNPTSEYTSSLNYVKIQTTGTGGSATISSTTNTNNIDDATKLNFTTKGVSERNNWDIFDYLFNYVTGETYSMAIDSFIYYINDTYYIKYNDYYIAIPLKSDETIKSVLNYDASTGSFGLERKTNRNVLNLMTSSNYKYSFKDASGITRSATTSFLTKYNSSATSGLSKKLYDFEALYFKTTDNKKVQGEGTLKRIDFSSGFDVSDYSTWTYSDYVIYYAFSQGMFGTDKSSYAFPFVYIPTWSKNGTTYYNLNYLDIILADYYGLEDDDNPTSFKYFENVQASYEFLLYYITSGTNAGYYLKLDDNYYVKLSENIKLDFTAMKATPELLGENLTLNDIAKRLEHAPEDSVKGVDASAITTAAPSVYEVTFDGKNFQTFVNAHGAPAYTYYLLKQNIDTGSSEANYVINFALNDTKGNSGTYFVYDTFYDFYNKNLKNYVETIKENSLDISMNTDKDKVEGNVKLYIQYENYYPDLEFRNYYYFALQETLSSVNTNLKKVYEVSQAAKTAIINETYEKKLINLKLSEDFDINNVSKWSVLDFILIHEFANEKINSNFFKDMLFTELSTNYLKNIAYFDSENSKVYLYLNNTFYDITDFVEEKDVLIDTSSTETVECYVGKTDSDSKINAAGDVVKSTNISSRSFRVLYETKNYSVNPNFTRTAEYYRDKDNISYEINNVTYFKYLDTEVADTNYRIDVSNYAFYTTKKYIKKVSWVEKLMTDMQVYYPDLNWGVLIATDGWLDTLGEFTSAHNNGLYISGENSANTTAAGLVLSEFFMSKATAVADSYADYEYGSIFDEETVDALMLSLMGEENYNALSLEIEVFMDFFNSCFAPIIDDFAEEFGESIGDNSLRLNAYKSYLATLLLSSDIGEYLYTIATRVYAEYTIGEYLAKSCGDYGNYYAYTNKLTDSDGNTIDSYQYGSFLDLLKYENEYCGKNNPTFTFNFEKAFDKYKDEEGKVKGYKYSDIFNDDGSIKNENYYSVVADSLISKIDEDYKKIYKNGYMVGDDGMVYDSDGVQIAEYEDDTYIYCYMIHVYWDIKFDVREEPTYLTLYRSYINGSISRWGILCDDEIETADQYFENYDSDKAKLILYKTMSSISSIRLFIPALTISTDDFFSALTDYLSIFVDFLDLMTTPIFSSTFKTKVGEMLTHYTMPLLNALDICSGNEELNNDVQTIAIDALVINLIMSFSEESDFAISAIIEEFLSKIGLKVGGFKESNWNEINAYYDSISNVLNELKQVRDLLPGQQTAKGSTREIASTGAYYTDDQLDQVISAFSTVATNLNSYIATQTKLDKAQKKSITFTLAQYGSNYVSTGYKFSVKNKSYTFKSTTDPVRLAEYVYGGEFLEEVGVGAQYTSSDFTGIVKSSKVYDNEDGTMKTQLNSWPQLRGFASTIAKETAELYFTTNLGDLDISKKNAILLTDKINVYDSSDTSSTMSAGSVEERLYKFIVSGIGNDEIVKRITNSDATTINVYTHDKFVSICKYIFSGDLDDNELENITLEDFKRIVVRKVIDNDQNESETAEERAGRYLTLFNLLSVQVDYKINDSSGTDIGRLIAKGNIERNNGYITYTNNVSNYGVGAVSEVENYDATVTTSNIKAIFSSSITTLEVVKNLSGLENRPTREVLTREYSGTRTSDYFDESLGDSFIACTYKNGLYYPIIGTGSRSYTENKIDGGVNITGKYDAYMNAGFLNHKFISEYYDNTANVVVMKGIITADGYPTAIRKYNNPVEVLNKKLFSSSVETYNSVTYYRTNIGASFQSGENLVDASRSIGRVTTQNYTKYETNTSFTKGIGSGEIYTGKSNLKTVVSSDYSSWFVQSKAEYLITQADDFGAICVLDEFSYFYVFGGQTWVLLLLAFVTLIPFMINAIGGAITRIFDVLVLFIISPLVISTNSLYPEGKNPTYKKWKKGIQINAYSAFGYIIGFSAFAILVPMINNVTTFVNVDTYNRIISIGGLGGFFSYPTINSLVKCLWIITAVTVFEKVPALLLPIITAGRGDIKSPHPSVISEGKPFTEKAKGVVKDVKDIKNKIKSVVSGRAAMGLMKEAKDEMLGMIPGSALVKMAKEGLIDPVAKKNKEKATAAEQKMIEALLESHGVDHQTAKAAGEAVKKAQEQKEKQKADKKKKWDGYQKEFKNLL